MRKRTNRSTRKAPSWHLRICFKHLQAGTHFTPEHVCETVRTFTKSRCIFRFCHTFTSGLAAITIPQRRRCRFSWRAFAWREQEAFLLFSICGTLCSETLTRLRDRISLSFGTLSFPHEATLKPNSLSTDHLFSHIVFDLQSFAVH